MKLNQLTGFVAVLFLGFLVACGAGDNKADLLAQKWVYDEVNVGDQTMSGEMLGNPVMSFNNDGTYTMEFGGMEETGTWKIEGDKLITTGDADGTDQELTILELTADKLLLEGEAEGTKMKVLMKPI